MNWFQCWFVAKSQLNSEEPLKNNDIIRADLTRNHPIRSWTIIFSVCRPSNYTSESLPSCIVTVYKVSHNMFVVAKQQLPCGNAGGGSDAGRERVWIVPLSTHGGRVWLIWHTHLYTFLGWCVSLHNLSSFRLTWSHLGCHGRPCCAGSKPAALWARACCSLWLYL